ncbi:MAG TPA: response regulator [Dehalococcoidia bacterium]|nr:response regulator [Dehalococcoidia bacterium]
MSQHRVLIIDDDPSLLRSIRLTLSVEGYAVETAVDGIDGLERVAQNAFDAIVVDLSMPRMDGRSFYRELRARGNETPVLILSAYGAHGARSELKAQAALDKPFDPDHLIEIVGEMMDGGTG